MTLAAGIEIGAPARFAPVQGQVPGKTPEAESFRSKWQDQLASLVSGAESHSADLETGEDPREEMIAGRSQTPTAGAPLQLRIVGTQQVAQSKLAAGQPSGASRGSGAASEIGVPAVRQRAVNGAVAGSAKVEIRQPGGPSNPERAARSDDPKAAEKNPKQTAAEGVSPAAATPLPILAGEVRSLAEPRSNAADAEKASSSVSATESGILAGGAMSDSSWGASHNLAAGGGDISDGTKTVSAAKTPEIRASDQAESRSPGNRGIAAQDSHGIETQPGTADEKSGYAAAVAGASTPGAGAQAVGRMNAEALPTGPETHPALSATKGAQTAPIPGAGAGMETIAEPESGSQSTPLPVGEPNQVNPAPSGDRAASLPGAKRSQHTAGAERSGPVQAQAAAGPADATAMIRDPAGGREATNQAVGSPPGTGEPALRETFAALDSDASPGAPTWTHASAQHAEAGFMDPTLGWIGVRADRSGGGIHAALVPGSAEAAQALGSHLEGLNAYLTAQHTPVESLGMATPERSAPGFSGEQAPGPGMGQGNGQGAGQDAGQNAQHSAHAEPESSGAMDGLERQGSRAAPGQPITADGTAQSQGRSGATISVVA
jgi:hypothetical protein